MQMKPHEACDMHVLYHMVTPFGVVSVILQT